jgi:hypothetical protein
MADGFRVRGRNDRRRARGEFDATALEPGAEPERRQTVWRGRDLEFIIGDDESILGFIPINTEDNIVHPLIGLAGLATQRAIPAPPRGDPAAAH